MSINKIKRFQLIDEAIQSKVKYNFKELREFLNNRLDDAVSERTVKQDISDLKNGVFRDKMAPIKCNQKLGYHYTDANFSLFGGELSEMDKGEVKNVITMLSQYQQYEQFSSIKESIQLLSAQFDVALQAEKKQQKIFYDEQPLKGIGLIADLHKVLNEDGTIQLLYRTFDGEEYDALVHPYLLKQYNNRWFLIGMTDSDKELRVYPLDRIIQFEQKEYSLEYPPQYPNVSALYNLCVGVTIYKDTQPENVKLKFYGNRKHYVLTKQLHKTQEVIEDTEDYLIVQLRVYLNKELESKILEYGADVEVLEPEPLRESIKGLFEKAIKRYQ
ncbi:WYL domain-containing protein [Persicobacter psychrovividus]|uniref:WYL domain-containing protein n=1 Tax=Persicobacter psychrovividus TaxID=387638 RepID=A0ABM7VM96_9BACT|nr:WYL domain-containing protein [Persicobacter psychrovividus]